MTEKQFFVVGLGTFGMSLSKALSSKKAQCLAIDVNKDRVDEAVAEGINAVVADATDEKALKKLGMSDFDLGVVTIGEDIGSSILSTLLMKDLGVRHIIVKSMNQHHSRIAAKVGADRIIHPESDMAVKLADALVMPSIIEEIEISDEFNLSEVILPEPFFNKTLAESKLKEDYNLTLVAIKRKETIISDEGATDFKEEMIVSPGSKEVLQEGDVVLVVGRETDIARLSALSRK